MSTQTGGFSFSVSAWGEVIDPLRLHEAGSEGIWETGVWKTSRVAMGSEFVSNSLDSFRK